jgi:hypothetical protein
MGLFCPPLLLPASSRHVAIEGKQHVSFHLQYSSFPIPTVPTILYLPSLLFI